MFYCTILDSLLDRLKYNFGIKVRARILTTIPDSTSQKFIIFGQIGRKDQQQDKGRYVSLFIDFADTRTRECQPDDFEDWYARSNNHDCVMGHKVGYQLLELLECRY